MNYQYIVVNTIFTILILSIFVFACEYANNISAYIILILYCVVSLINQYNSYVLIKDDKFATQIFKSILGYSKDELIISAYINAFLLVLSILYCIYKIIIISKSSNRQNSGSRGNTAMYLN
jgi:hypothetical protein